LVLRWVVVWAEVVEVEGSTASVEGCLAEGALEGHRKGSPVDSSSNDQTTMNHRIFTKLPRLLMMVRELRIENTMPQKVQILMTERGGSVKHGWVSYWRAFSFLLISWPF
jgi:hypothetical protein